MRADTKLLNQTLHGGRALIIVDQVSYTYPSSKIPAVSEISLTIALDERLAIIGSSGSGKSTLGYLLAGLAQPTHGRIVCDVPGDALRNAGPDDSSEVQAITVAIVLQNPETQLIGATVEEDVALGPENLALASDEIRRRVDWALETIGIQHLAKRPVESLSGGEKQRVAVAGALAMRPSCLVLDEASAMLHPEAKRQLETAIARIRRDGVAIVQITHDMEEAARADRIAVLHQGKLVATGGPSSILSDQALLSRCGLEPPESLQLALALRQKGVDLPGQPLDVPELADAIAKAVAP